MPGSVSHPPFPDTGTVALVEDDDAALVARARRDRQAFTSLYERYFDATQATS